ncbi:hypothetical protein G6F37_000920 [Rhizopus arrhizus]|nr:hypothetical protein G6F38_002401 [Rhizopus arrhizus]KAG1163753.1 hypothetical protein G6F37_000920 [Rhizopus arrhizus]
MENLPYQGAIATAQRNNSLLLFGGENATSHYTNTFYQLTQTSSTYDWSTVPQTNTPPGVSYAQAVVVNNSNDMYVIGGMDQDTLGQMAPLQYYKYSFDSQSWTAASTNNLTNATGVPLNRYLFSATYDGNNTIYIFGGRIYLFSTLPYFHKFDISTGQFTELPGPGVSCSGHTASYLSTGQLVILGGAVSPISGNNSYDALTPMNQTMVYDTITNTWSTKTITSNNDTFPSSRMAHNAVVTSDNNIIIFGGTNLEGQQDKEYFNSLAILDTNSWTWTVPNVQGIPPVGRTLASAGILDGKHLTVAFGMSLNSFYNDVNVLNISTNTWLQSFSTEGSHSLSNSSSLSGGIIAGIVIACVVVALIVLLLLWRFQTYIRWLFMRIHKDIWKPRTGEPLWAETTRIVFQIFLLFIFTVFLVFMIRQVINSPNVTQSIEEQVDTVSIPDIRFCFEGYTDDPDITHNPGVDCQTESGYSCNLHIQKLDMSRFTPGYTGSSGQTTCFLFRPPPDFVLSSTEGYSNGSRLIFTFFDNSSVIEGSIQVSIYPQNTDPNLIVYGLSNEVHMDEDAISSWKMNEINNIQINNVYNLEPPMGGALSYTFVNHHYLQNNAWNYVGFSPITNSTVDIRTAFSSKTLYASFNDTRSQLIVYPERFVNMTDKEVKIYTLVNAFGFMGGIFGLFATLQACLFGFRPRSPWGFVHRWSVGGMRRSLFRGLQSNFKKTDFGIPLVEPVRPYTANVVQTEENEAQRMVRMEGRIQMLEALLKSYYVDDEVFESVKQANLHCKDEPLDSPLVMNDKLKVEKMGNNDSTNSWSPSYDDREIDSNSVSHIPLTRLDH